MQISNAEFDGDFITSCTLDGVDVSFLNPAWTGADLAAFTLRSAGGAAILNAFLPGAGLIAGGIVGAFSFLIGKGEGYYDKTGKKRRGGKLYRSDFNWN